MTITEARTREIVREEIGRWWRSGESVAGLKAMLQGDDSALQLGNTAEQSGDRPAYLSDVSATLNSLAHVINHGLGDGQALGDIAGEPNELHDASPSFVADSGAGDTASVGERPGLGTSTSPGRPNSHTVDVVGAFRQLDRDAAKLDDIRAALDRAVSNYVCACGAEFEFTAESTIDDYAALNRWLGQHDACEEAAELPITHVSVCPCGSRLEILGELDADDYDAIHDFDADHGDCAADL